MAGQGSIVRRYSGFRKSARSLVFAGLINMTGSALMGFILILYLNVLGHNNSVFGSLGLVMEVSTVIILVVSGLLADKYGKKGGLMLGIGLSAMGMLLFFLTESLPLFFVAAILIGLGGGFDGPSFNGLLAELSSAKRRKYLFSFNSLLNLMGSGTITIIGGFIPLLLMSSLDFGSVEAYRMVFLFAFSLKMVSMLLLARIPKPRPKRPKAGEDACAMPAKKPWGLIFKFALPNVFTGLGAGMIVPYFQIFFKNEFHLDLGSIGIIFAMLSFVMAGITIFLPRLAEKRGSVLTIFVFHAASIVAMIAIPFTPWLAVVVFLFIFRAAMMNVPHPIMTAFMQSMMPDNCRSTAQSALAFSWMVTHAVGIYIGGFVWDSVYVYETLPMRYPFYVATILYIIATVIFAILFYGMDDKKHKPLPHLHKRPSLGNLYNR
ncbi:MAG: MFS transporter [Thermoplasmata archaeon]|nr:MFS transporter [Thermoplasmata archaeon]